MFSGSKSFAVKVLTVVLSVLLIFSLPIVALGDESENALSYSQKHVVEEYLSKNAAYAERYFSGSAVPMDGSGGRADIVIPGLSTEDNMIPQGLALYPAKNLILISAYYNTIESSEENAEEINSKQTPSVIYALDASNGAFVAQFDLYSETGKAITNHVGGIAVSENNLYVATGRRVAYVSLSSLEVEPGTRKDLRISGRFDIQPYSEAAVSYLNCSGGILWAGNFFDKSEGYNEPAYEGVNSRILGYALSGKTASEEISNLMNGETSPVPKHIIDLPSEVERIQGITSKNGMLFLSKSFGRRATGSIYIVSLNKAKRGAKLSDFRSIDAIPAIEGMDVRGRYIYTLSEGGAWYFNGYDPSNLSSAPSDVVWRIDTLKMLKNSVAYCVCGEQHTGSLSPFVVLFHKVQYFFNNLFNISGS